MPSSVGQVTWGEVLESEGEVVLLDSVLSHIKSLVEREQGQEDAPVTYRERTFYNIKEQCQAEFLKETDKQILDCAAGQ